MSLKTVVASLSVAAIGACAILVFMLVGDDWWVANNWYRTECISDESPYTAKNRMRKQGVHVLTGGDGPMWENNPWGNDPKTSGRRIDVTWMMLGTVERKSYYASRAECESDKKNAYVAWTPK